MGGITFVHACAAHREVEELKARLQHASLRAQPDAPAQPHPAHIQQLQAAAARYQQAEAASAQHLRELTALRGQFQSSALRSLHCLYLKVAYH